MARALKESQKCLIKSALFCTPHTFLPGRGDYAAGDYKSLLRKL